MVAARGILVTRSWLFLVARLEADLWESLTWGFEDEFARGS